MKKILLALFVFTLSACISPYNIKVKDGHEDQLSCDQIAYEIQKTEQARKDAHNDDKWSAKKIIPTYGISTVYNLWTVDGDAKKRTELLNKIAEQKGCKNKTSGNENYMVVAQYIPVEQPETQEFSQVQMPQEQPEVRNTSAQIDDKEPENEDPRTKDQSQSEYLKNGYDSEVYPRKDPNHFIF